jgi:hypothetical protein
VPPKEGSTNLANIGSMRNSRAALTKMVVEKRIIIKAPPESLFLAEPFSATFPPADIKLGAFLPLVLALLESCDSSAQL